MYSEVVLDFRFRHWKEKEKAPIVGESGLFLTLGSGTSSAQNENLRLLLNRNIPLIIVRNMASETTFDHRKVVFS